MPTLITALSPYAWWLVLATLAAFALYGYDKLCARSGWWRVPEIYLLGVSLVGGAVGGLAAMLLFRHKTRKLIFFVVQIAGLALHAVLLFAALRR